MPLFSQGFFRSLHNLGQRGTAALWSQNVRRRFETWWLSHHHLDFRANGSWATRRREVFPRSWNLCLRSRAWPECPHDEVDHLIECRFWLVGALGDHQRIEELAHGRHREHRRENNVRHFEHALFRAIIDDLRNDADHTFDVRIIDLPVVLHGRRYHPMELFIAGVAPSIHEMNGRKKPSQPIDRFAVLGRDRCRHRFDLSHHPCSDCLIDGAL